jgi:hypothetical protein
MGRNYSIFNNNLKKEFIKFIKIIEKFLIKKGKINK